VGQAFAVGDVELLRERWPVRVGGDAGMERFAFLSAVTTEPPVFLTSCLRCL
jgi:hypothetical protein